MLPKARKGQAQDFRRGGVVAGCHLYGVHVAASMRISLKMQIEWLHTYLRRSPKMFKITGLNTLSHDLEQAQKAMAGMDGELGTVKFNPHDPASIDAAVQEVERLVDERLGGYSDNAIVGPMIDAMKEQYRTAIFDQAASARMTDGADDGR